MERRKEWTTSQCPRCKQHNEGTTHVLVCRAPEAVDIWNQQMKKLQKWLTRQRTHSYLQDRLMNMLRTWHSHGEPSLITVPGNPELSHALKQQFLIPIPALLMGNVALDITKFQGKHLRQLKVEKSNGASWTAGLIVQLIEIGFTMWDHRNSVLHAPQSWRYEMEKDELLKLCELQLELGSSTLLPSNKYLTHTTLDKLKARTITQVRDWLDTIQTARKAYRRSLRMARKRQRQRNKRLNNNNNNKRKRRNDPNDSSSESSMSNTAIIPTQVITASPKTKRRPPTKVLEVTFPSPTSKRLYQSRHL